MGSNTSGNENGTYGMNSTEDDMSVGSPGDAVEIWTNDCILLLKPVRPFPALKASTFKKAELEVNQKVLPGND